MKKGILTVAAIVAVGGMFAGLPVQAAQTFTFEVTCKDKNGFSQKFCQGVTASGSGKAMDIVTAQYPQCRVQSVTYCRN